MMRLPFTLSRYILLRTLAGTASVFLGLAALVFTLDLIELLRRAGSNDAVGVGTVVKLGLLKLPHMTEVILPFAVLFGAMLTFFRLTRNQELVVARSAGVSVWQFLLPAVLTAVGIALFSVMVYNPVSASLLSRYEFLEGAYLRNQPSSLSISASGLWVRQQDADGYAMINAQKLVQNTREINDVMILRFDNQNNYRGRLDAEQGFLEDGHWRLVNVWQAREGEPAVFTGAMTMPTNLSFAEIQDSFASPETMSFWTLPGFIKVLQDSGFSALNHRLYWHSQLATPLLLAAMVLVAAVFSLRQPRKGRLGMMIVGGITSGFMVYFLSDLIHAYGLSAQIPVALAAWAPALITTCCGVTLLLHLEDG